jgi:hypothetical protein
MPKAEHDPATHRRRSFLRFAAAATALSLPVALGVQAVPAEAGAATPVPGTDAELIELVSIMTRSQATIALIELEPGCGFDSPECAEDYDRRVGVGLDAFWGAAERVVDMTAITPAGWHAKAEAMRLILLQCVCTNQGETLDDIGEHDFEDRMAWSLARDLLAGSAVA